MRVWSNSRLADSAVLAAWAVFFWLLILDDRIPLYLSPRTAWLVPVGAAVFSVAAGGRLLSARTDHREPLTRKSSIQLAVFAVPLILMVALPPATLGSFAATRRTGFLVQGLAPGSPENLSTGDLSLVDLAGALRTPRGTRQLAKRAGDRVSFVGFVSRDPADSADEFTLNRFVITCCPGDALTVSVRVTGAPSGKFKPDTWVRITGALYALGQEAIVQASGVEGVDRPNHPYLSP
jgi:uncharacterized repeat protein (TIGR03943 family)